jgi:hypothetical protein
MYYMYVLSLAVNTVTLKKKKILHLNFESVIFIRLFIVFSHFGAKYCTISCDIKMEWGDKENRIAVIALHKVGMEPNAIFKTLHTLGRGARGMF